MRPTGGTTWPLASGVAFFVLVAVMALGSIRAQTTTITPTSGVGDLGTEVSEPGPVHTIRGGTRPADGPNLFHSFHSASTKF